ncbi:hypothetical protein ABSA28_00561 [Candidatus Hepatincolaceae symbiont of Richtersius coronifer]
MKKSILGLILFCGLMFSKVAYADTVQICDVYNNDQLIAKGKIEYFEDLDHYRISFRDKIYYFNRAGYSLEKKATIEVAGGMEIKGKWIDINGFPYLHDYTNENNDMYYNSEIKNLSIHYKEGGIGHYFLKKCY